jgi:hypothetical protein
MISYLAYKWSKMRKTPRVKLQISWLERVDRRRQASHRRVDRELKPPGRLMRAGFSLAAFGAPTAKAFPFATLDGLDWVGRPQGRVYHFSELEISMKYISTWKLPPNLIDAAVKKFLETGGAAPEGVKMQGRWHGMNGAGVAIFESNDATAIYKWYAQWANVMELSITPCVEDAEAGRYGQGGMSAGLRSRAPF